MFSVLWWHDELDVASLAWDLPNMFWFYMESGVQLGRLSKLFWYEMKYCVQLEFCVILYEILRAVGTCVVVGAMVGRE